MLWCAQDTQQTLFTLHLIDWLVSPVQLGGLLSKLWHEFQWLRQSTTVLQFITLGFNIYNVLRFCLIFMKFLPKYRALYFLQKKGMLGVVARSDACPPGMRTIAGSIFTPAKYSVIEIWSWKNFYSDSLPSADSRRASFQLLAEEWARSTGKNCLGGLPRNKCG